LLADNAAALDDAFAVGAVDGVRGGPGRGRRVAAGDAASPAKGGARAGARVGA